MARTDARAGLGMDEAIYRCQQFRALGADITFLEAPESVEEMKRYCQEASFVFFLCCLSFVAVTGLFKAFAF
jgi:2-methylisocitrate lyase-like PEP mutase family enzyme